MATTTNFGWDTPDDTDLVKDGAAAIRTLGSSIDTSFVDLKGGTTNQVLAKNSGTDLDFKWVADATGIPATIFDAKGDIIAATAADTADRLAVGTNNQVLTVDSTTATGLKWATPAAAGGKTLLSTTALSGTTTTVSGISGSYTDLYVYVLAHPSVSATVSINFNSYSGWLGYYVRGGNSGTPGVTDTNGASNLNSINTFDNSAGGAIDVFVPQYATSGAGKYKMAQYNFLNSNGTTLSGVAWASGGSGTAAITGVTVSSTQTLTGTILVYGIS